MVGIQHLYGGTKISDTTTVPAANTTYYAHWTVNKYTLTYDFSTNGGTSATKTTATVAYGSPIDLTPTATKPGWDFIGWNTSSTATTGLDSDAPPNMPANNLTVFAIFKKTLTGTFKYYNNLSTTKSVTIYNTATSGSITAPAALGTPSGYTFRHWSTSSAANASKTVGASTAITISANTTYYASYQQTVTGTFYYCTLASSDGVYTNAGQTSTTATATKYIGYTGTIINSNFTVPAAVTGSSAGISAQNYVGVSTSTGSATTSTPTTASTKFYAVYTEPLTFYYYNGTSDTSKAVTRRMLSNGTTYSNSLSEAAPTPSAYSGASFNAWSYDSTQYASSYLRTPLATGVNSLYAVYTKALSATFYYNSNTTNGGLTVSHTTSSATTYYVSKSGGINTYNGTLSVPSAVTASVGKYNSNYKGVSSSLSSMTTTTSFASGTTYYAVYSSGLTIYYPTSTTVVGYTMPALFRNEYFTSTTAMATKTNTSQTNTNQATTLSISAMFGTFAGLATSVNTTTRYAVNSTTIVNSNITEYCAVTTTTLSGTVYYNSNTTSGSFTKATASVTATRTNYCETLRAAKTSTGAWSMPTAVTGSVGKYNSKYIGVSSSLSSMTTTTSYTNGGTYYAVYRTSVTVRYQTTHAGTNYTTTTLYRNEYFTSTTAMTTKLASTTTGTSDITTVSSAMTGTFIGFSNSANSTTIAYKTIANLRDSSATSVYAVSANYQNTNTSTYYITLSAALSNVATGQTIKVLNNINETIAPTLASGKTVTLNTNSMMVKIHDIAITNNGTLTITGTGNIQNDGTPTNYTIKNYGTLTINGPTIYNYSTTNYQPIINNEGATLKILAGKISGSYRAIWNNGTLNITGGEVTATASECIKNNGTMTMSNGKVNADAGKAIDNVNSATLSITGGEIIGSTDAIYTSSTGAITIAGATITGGSSNAGVSTRGTGDITINSGTITGHIGVYKESATLDVRGGTISGDSIGIQQSGGYINIRGGTVQASKTDTECAIKNTTGGIFIYGGTVTTATGCDAAIINDGSGTLYIYGGTVSGGYGSNAGIEISGGTINLYEKSYNGSGANVSGYNGGIVIPSVNSSITINMGSSSKTFDSNSNFRARTPLIRSDWGDAVANKSSSTNVRLNWYNGAMSLTKTASPGVSGQYIYTTPDFNNITVNCRSGYEIGSNGYCGLVPSTSTASLQVANLSLRNNVQQQGVSALEGESTYGYRNIPNSLNSTFEGLKIANSKDIENDTKEKDEQNKEVTENVTEESTGEVTNGEDNNEITNDESKETEDKQDTNSSEVDLPKDETEGNESEKVTTDEESNIVNTAKVGETEYKDITEALANAKNGEEVILLEDIMLKEVIKIDKNLSIKINLNGHKIQSETGETFENYGTIEIIDTSKQADGMIVGKITNYNNMKIKGGTIVDKEQVQTEEKIENKTDFDKNNIDSIIQRKNVTIDNKKGELSLSGGVVENNSDNGIVIYNSKEGKVVFEAGKLTSSKNNAIGILNVDGSVQFNINEEIVDSKNNNYINDNNGINKPEVTLSGLNSIGIYCIGENTYLELQHGIITAQDTIVGIVTKVLEGYKVREEEIESMHVLTLAKEGE